MDFMEQSSLWEANSCWATQKISPIVYNPKVHWSVHRSTTGPCPEHDESGPYSSHLVHHKQYAADRFLGVFAKLQKIDTWLWHVCPSVHLEQLSSHWMDFREVWCLSILKKSVKKIQVSLKFNTNNGYFTRKPIYIFYPISLSSS